MTVKQILSFRKTSLAFSCMDEDNLFSVANDGFLPDEVNDQTNDFGEPPRILSLERHDNHSSTEANSESSETQIDPQNDVELTEPHVQINGPSNQPNERATSATGNLPNTNQFNPKRKLIVFCPLAATRSRFFDNQNLMKIMPRKCLVAAFNADQ